MTKEPQAPESPKVEIQLRDLAIAVQAIDMASTKGVYVGSDMEVVGRVRNTLAAFVQANAPQEEPPKAEATEE